jgi:hypothetical protein
MWNQLFLILVGALCVFTGWAYALRPIELYEHQQVRWFSVLRRVLPKAGFLIYARVLGLSVFVLGCVVLVVAGRDLWVLLLGGQS